MIHIVEMILMGIWATLFMDILSIVFSKLRVIHLTIEPHLVGRWILYMFRGKFIHNDIYKSDALSNEKLSAFIAHYLIGILLAGIYLLWELKEPIIRDILWIPLIFGFISVLLPWLWLYPSMGLGFLASKTQKKSSYIITSLVNHTNFGFGFVVWIVTFRPFIT